MVCFGFLIFVGFFFLIGCRFVLHRKIRAVTAAPAAAPTLAALAATPGPPLPAGADLVTAARLRPRTRTTWTRTGRGAAAASATTAAVAAARLPGTGIVSRQA